MANIKRFCLGLISINLDDSVSERIESCMLILPAKLILYGMLFQNEEERPERHSCFYHLPGKPLLVLQDGIAIGLFLFGI